MLEGVFRLILMTLNPPTAPPTQCSPLPPSTVPASFSSRVALMLEGEFHLMLMLGDFAFIGLLADFLLAYARSVSSSGLEAHVIVSPADMI